MDAVSYKTPLNPAQLFVLQTLAVTKDNQDKEELTSLYLDYIQRKMDMVTNKWWKDNNMTNEKLDEMLNAHYRTPYK